MKKVFILGVLALTIKICNAQACKPFYEGNDPYTNDKFVLYGDIAVATAAGQALFGEESVTIHFALGYFNDTALIVWIQFLKSFGDGSKATVRDFTINKGEKLNIITSSGGLILEAMEDQQSTSEAKVGYTQVSIQQRYSVKKEQAKQIAESTLQNIRVNLSNTSAFTGEVTAKREKKLKEQFNCFLKVMK